jgi:uncharacterized protein (DUF934 family)
MAAHDLTAVRLEVEGGGGCPGWLPAGCDAHGLACQRILPPIAPGGREGGSAPADSTRALDAVPAPATSSAGAGGARDWATIWQDGAFRRDTWVRATEGEPLPDTPVILSKRRWLAERAALTGHSAPLGLHLDAGERLDDLAADLARFSLIALAFPKFSDGRAFSSARLLRDKYAYRGELRAVGNVLSDLIPFMRRVGFESFEVTHGPTRRALIEGRISEVTLHYQPAGSLGARYAARRPWLARCGS